MNNHERNLRIIEMRHDGHTYTDIAIETECSVPYVKSVLAKVKSTRDVGEVKDAD